MRTIGNLPITKKTDAKYASGATIQNETDTQDGTPVIEEIYGDVLQNMYKLLEVTNETPTNVEDSNDSEFQILKALKRLPNNQNDIEQVLTLTSNVWSVPFDFSALPNKYFFFARPTDAFLPGQSYTIQGTDGNPIAFTSQTGFNASDEVLVVLDTGTVRAYSLTRLNQVTEVFNVFGQPLSYNDSSKLYYQENGNILTDDPSIGLLESVIRFDAGNGTLIVNEMFILSGKVICVVFDPTAITYLFYSFDLTDLTTSTLISVSGGSIPTGTDNTPYFYCSSAGIYVTNKGGSNVNDYELEFYGFDSVSNTLTYSSLTTLDTSFVKTTNIVIGDNDLFSLISGVLNKFPLNGGSLVSLGNYNTVIGFLFSLDGKFYFTGGDVAKRWTL
tara:strand:- start:1335 stop:2495 length:1161 start_codon:yes stop_codon:yes gene_type:complete